MLKELFSNRLFIGALAFFALCVGGSLLYMWHVEREGAEYDAETQDRVAQWNEKQQPQPSAEVPVGDTTQGGHFHEDGTWHGEPHDPQMPRLEESQTIVVQLTPKELDGLYHQITAEISQMSSEEELNRGLDLSKYTPKQLAHLQTVGINLSRLPQKLQDKITDHQWRQKGVEPPPAGYTYLQREDGTYFLYKEGEPLISPATVTAGDGVDLTDDKVRESIREILKAGDE